jgi:cyclase
MRVHKIRPHITAVIPEGSVVSQAGCNVGLIHTAEGVILVDTTIGIKRMQGILNAIGIHAADICLVINTHLHADHINGNSLFKCPVICHSKGKARMAKKCTKVGQSLITFDIEHEVKIGNVHIRLMHKGGHTPESSIVWLPEDKVLFSGDLIFSGRAPFLASVTNFNALVKALMWLPSLEAEVIIPGHGPLCNVDEVHAQVDYLQSTWEVIKEHVEKGHSLATIRNDLSMPEMEGKNYERNIEWIYKRLTK